MSVLKKVLSGARRVLASAAPSRGRDPWVSNDERVREVNARSERGGDRWINCRPNWLRTRRD